MDKLQLHLDRPSIDQTLRILNYARSSSPIVVLVVFLASFVVYGIKNAPDDSDKVQVHAMKGPGGRPLPTRRRSANQIKDAATVKDVSPTAKVVFRTLQTGLLMTFLANAGIIIVQTLAFRKHEWWPGQSAVIYVAASFFAWAVVAISLIDTKPSPTWVHQLTWIVALPFEILILACSLRIYSGPHNEPRVGHPQGGKHRNGPTVWEVTEIIVLLVRIGCLLAMIALYLFYWWSFMKSSNADNAQDGERESLLNEHHHANGNGHTYGASGSPKTEHKPPHDAWAKPTETPNITWYAYLRGFVVLIPYLWPRKSVKLQCLALVCILIMISQRVVTVFVPILIGKIVDALSGEHGHKPQAPWLLISFYILCRWLQGGQGLLSAARSILWIPVEQYSYRAISTAAFEHVHGLSAEFHTGKRTGELISALNKGSAINSFLEMITFNVGPMIVDLIVAIVFLAIRFDVYLGLVVAIVTFSYVYVTIRLASWRVTLRRNYTNADREMEAVKNDSLHSWDTVKYFNAEAYEFQRYKLAIKAMQGFEYWVQVTLAYMNTIQGAIFTIALLVACFIEAYQVATGLQSVGDFTSLITYMMQLQAPLNFFGTFYRAIQNNLINAERMLELFKEEPVVVDKEDARDLDDCQGDIVFDNVTFGYDPRKPALSNLSFRCAPGTTTALVGESGGGKTTVMRLIFRYYNPEAGNIRVDGTDVQDLTIDSLRSHIGVVPQDCNMFNESIMYNLRYADQNATDEEIVAACKAASIHDRIMMFPEGYETKVGERGVRLSGGERQRVAIARTILKNPKITLLDEATAALDTETEERIQNALKQLAIGRTMLIIAHRLSTITEADQILVLSGGTIIERGTHTELIEKGGKYASMWRKQSRAQRAAEEAEELRIKAKRTLEAAEVDSANVSEDEADRASLRGDKSPGGYSGVAKRLVTGTSSNSSSNRAVRGHKRVNFSLSSLGRTWGPPSDEDSSEDQQRYNGGQKHGDDKAGNDNNSGKPPGHP